MQTARTLRSNLIVGLTLGSARDLHVGASVEALVQVSRVAIAVEASSLERLTAVHAVAAELGHASVLACVRVVCIDFLRTEGSHMRSDAGLTLPTR